MGCRSSLSSPLLTIFAMTGIAIAVGSCSALPRSSSTVGSSKNSPVIVAAVGRTEKELSENVSALQGGNADVRFVTVESSGQKHIFPVFAQILRSDHYLIARGYSRMYFFSRFARVKYNKHDVTDLIPEVDFPPLLTSYEPAKRVSKNGDFFGFNPTNFNHFTTKWLGLKDPWQVYPDYVVADGYGQTSTGDGAKSGTRSVSDMAYCNLQIFGGCYYGGYAPPIPYYPKVVIFPPNPTPVPPTPQCYITSATNAALPADHSRTTIGVAESVSLFSNGSSWSVSGAGKISPSGNTAQFVASETAGSATISVDGGSTCSSTSISFTIIAPSGVVAQRVGGILHSYGLARIGIQTNRYLQPDSVSFTNISVLEVDASASATGPYACLSGIGHSPNQTPLVPRPPVPGLGSLFGLDSTDSGYCGNLNQMMDGYISFYIPNVYLVNGTRYLFANDAQLATSASSGALAASKESAIGSSSVTSPNSSY